MSIQHQGEGDTGRRGFTLSAHLKQKLKYDQDTRLVDREVINEAVIYGDTVDYEDGGHEVVVTQNISGIKFRVVLNEVNEVVQSAYPTEFSRFDAVTSNRWTQTQIEGIEERIEEGKTEEV